MDGKTKIKDFTDLIVWKEGHRLVLSVYKHTKNFPKHEQFALTSQMNRCVVSVTSNISEGFARRSKKEKLQFYYTAISSLSELRNQLIISRDLNYITQKEFENLEHQVIKVRRLLSGLIKSSSDKVIAG